MLMVMYKGKHNGTYWNEEYLDKDLRCGLDLLARWPEKVLPKGNDHLLLRLAFRDDINGHEAAKPYAEDYRSPGKLEVTMGKADTTDAGDHDADGFNEAEGCYVLSSVAEGVAFTLPGRRAPRLNPAFKVLRWKGTVPTTIRDGDKILSAGMVLTVASILILQFESKDPDANIRTGGAGCRSGRRSGS